GDHPVVLRHQLGAAGLTRRHPGSYPGPSTDGPPTAPSCSRARPRASDREPSSSTESESSPPMVYAIVRAGGRQEKVAVGDVLEIDRLHAEPGASVELPVLLLVDGADVTSDKAVLAKASVTVE